MRQPVLRAATLGILAAECSSQGIPGAALALEPGFTLMAAPARPAAAEHDEHRIGGGLGARSVSIAERPFSLHMGLGFTASPTLFLTAVEGNVALSEYVRIGPLIQIGSDRNRTLVAPSAQVQFVLDLEQLAPHPVPLKPFAQMGLGFAYLDQGGRRRKKDDVGFLIHMGGGIEYYLMDNFAIGTRMQYNWLPHEVIRERGFFSWQVLSLTFRF